MHRVARSVGRPVFGDTEQSVRSGNWWGNDTVWRMCLDLNKIVLYGNPDGSLRAPLPRNRKRHYALVDGILAGQGRGPLNPDPVAAGVVLFGVHPPSVDTACAYLMGFDPAKIPIVTGAFQSRGMPLADHSWRDVEVCSNHNRFNSSRLCWICSRMRFCSALTSEEYRPCFQRERRDFAKPSGVRGPVLAPPCIRQRPLRIAGD